ncbi:MAG: GIY-YIG nuclease family protein [Verrucomicrobia bacterium]|nr:GIY-YIG nuclease family protein [Verrucomicrobiota bacterium]
MPPPDPSSAWFLYVLRCGDGSLYCGVTTDVTRRLHQHATGTGARYTRGRGPLSVAATWEMESRSSVLKAEAAFKTLPRWLKEQAIAPDAPLFWLPS